MKIVTIIFRLLLGGVFVFTGVVKVLNPQLFAHEIDQYSLVPHEMIHLLAITLPWVELMCGVMLVAGLWVRANALLLAGLSVVFFFAITSVLARGLKIKCGCFGAVGDSFVGPWNLALDIALLAIAVWIYMCTKEEK